MRLAAKIDRLRMFRRTSVPKGSWRIEAVRNNGEVVLAVDGVPTGATDVRLRRPQ